MGESFQWSRKAVGLRSQLPPDVAEAIDAAGAELPPDADTEAVLVALRARGFGFPHVIVGLMAIQHASLAEAKQLVHTSASFANERDAREEFWAALHAEALDVVQE